MTFLLTNLCMPREHGPAWARDQCIIEKVLLLGKSTGGTLLGRGKGWEKREKYKTEHNIAKINS